MNMKLYAAYQMARSARNTLRIGREYDHTADTCLLAARLYLEMKNPTSEDMVWALIQSSAMPDRVRILLKGIAERDASAPRVY